MANASDGTLLSSSPQNLTGFLFQRTNPDTPLFNRIGRVTTDHKEYIMGAEYQLATPGAVEISEDDSMVAPAPGKTLYTNNQNVTQIFQKSVQETYRSMSNKGALTKDQPAFVGATNNRPNKLQREKAYKLAEIRMEIEWAILNGTYNLSAGSADPDQTRGLLEAITTNVIAAGGEPLSYDLICDMAEMLTAEFADGLERTTILIDATTARQLSRFIVNSDKFVANQNQMGANAMQVLTPFGVANFMRISNKYLPEGTAVFADLNAMNSVIQPVPGKGAFFYEPLARVGAAEHGQIYGEWGLDYGIEGIHGKITGLSTDAGVALGGTAVHVVNAEDFPVSTP